MAITPVQSASSNSSVANANSATFASTPTAGNLIVICIGNSTNITALTSVLDGNSNAATLITSNGQTSRTSYQYAYIAGASQSKTFTATLSGAAIDIDIYEFTGNYPATNGIASTFYDGASAFQSVNYVAQTFPGDFNATPVAPLITTVSVGSIIVANTASATGMGTITGQSMGDALGTGTNTIGFLNPVSPGTISFSGYQTNPSIGNHQPYFNTTGGTARAGSASTVAYKPAPPVATLQSTALFPGNHPSEYAFTPDLRSTLQTYYPFAGLPVGARLNLVQNPSAESVTNIPFSGGSRTTIQGTSLFGIASEQITTSIAANNYVNMGAGTSYVAFLPIPTMWYCFSVFVFVPIGSTITSVYCAVTDWGGNYYGMLNLQGNRSNSVFAVNQGQWTRVWYTVQGNATDSVGNSAANNGWRFLVNVQTGNSTTPQLLYYDGYMIEPLGETKPASTYTPQPYFDGTNQAYNYNSYWLGNPNASVSYALPSQGANAPSTNIPVSTNTFPNYSPQIQQFVSDPRSPLNSNNPPIAINPVISNGIIFDGVQNYVSLGTMGNFGISLANGFYCSFNINTTATNLGYFGWGQAGGHNVQISLNSNAETGTNHCLCLTIRGDNGLFIRGSAQSPTINFNDGNTHNIIMTSNTSLGTVTILIDGIQQLIQYTSTGIPTFTTNFSYPFLLGARNYTGVVQNFIACSLSNFQIGTSSVNLFGIYNFSEDSGLITYDSSTYNNIGTLTGTPPPSWAIALQSYYGTLNSFDSPGITPQTITNFRPDSRSTQSTGLPATSYAIQFADRVTSSALIIPIPDKVRLLSPQQQMTLIVVIKVMTGFDRGVSQPQLTVNWNIPGLNGYGFVEQSANQIYSALIRSAAFLTGGNGVQSSASTSGAVFQTPIQMAITYDGTLLRAYYNGQLIGFSNGNGVGFNLSMLPSIWTINPVSSTTSGSIILDDLQLYNTVLTTAQMAQTIPGQIFSGLPPIIWFPFNEGQGNTTVDVINGLVGTFGGTNSPKWVSSIIGTPGPMGQTSTTVFPGSPMSKISKIPDLRSTSNSPSGIQNIMQYLTASLQPLGTFVANAKQQLSASLTPSGVLIIKSKQLFNAAITPAGSILNKAKQLFSGSITPSATIKNNPKQNLSATVHPTATMIAKTKQTFTARLSFIATIVNAIKGSGTAVTPTYLSQDDDTTYLSADTETTTMVANDETTYLSEDPTTDYQSQNDDTTYLN